MALKFDKAVAGYYAIPDDAALTLPAGDWCIGVWVKIANNTGNFYQYLISNNHTDVANSINIFLGESSAGTTTDRGRWRLHLRDSSNTLRQLGTGKTNLGADNTWRIVLAQYSTATGRLELWTCPLNGTAELLDSVTISAPTVDGGNWRFGERTDGNADRRFGQHACELWVGNNFALTQAEIENLATGKRVSDVHSPAIYYPAETADATLTDLGSAGLTATKTGSVATSVETHPVTASSGAVAVTASPQAQAATASASLAVQSDVITLHGDFDGANVDVANSTVGSGVTPTIFLQPYLTTTDGTTGSRWAFWMARMTNALNKQPTIQVPEASNYLGVSNRALFSYDRITWTQFSSGIDAGANREYSHSSAFTQDTVYVASIECFSNTELEQWITDNDGSAYLHETPTSISYGGSKYQYNLTRSGDTAASGSAIPQLPMYGFKITDTGQQPDDGRGKRDMVVTGGVHAGEMVGTWAAIGEMDFLLSADPVAASLRKNWNIWCYPITNVSGRWGGHFRGTYENTKNTNRDFSLDLIDVMARFRAALLNDTGGTVSVFIDHHGWKGALYQHYWDTDATARAKYEAKLDAYATYTNVDVIPADAVPEYGRASMGASFIDSTEIGTDAVTSKAQMTVWGEYHARVANDLWLDNEFQIPVLVDVTAVALNATCGCTVHPNRKSVRVNLVNASGTPQTGLSNIKFALWDAATPDLIATVPSAKGAAGTTDGSGDLQFYADSSTLMPGQVGIVWVTDSDGNPVNQANSHAHPVEMGQE